MLLSTTLYTDSIPGSQLRKNDLLHLMGGLWLVLGLTPSATTIAVTLKEATGPAPETLVLARDPKARWDRVQLNEDLAAALQTLNP